MKATSGLIPFFASLTRPTIVFLTAILAIMPPSAANAQAFRGLGWFAPEEGLVDYPQTSRVRAMSADGSVVVGHSIYSFAAAGGTASSTQAFRWHQDTGMNRLGLIPGAGDYTVGSSATGVSSDGNRIVGHQLMPANPNFPQPFLWLAGSGWGSGLGRISGHYASQPFGLSGDGQVVVGSSTVTQGSTPREAFRWTAESGMRGLGFLPGNTQNVSVAHSTSANGEVLVGVSSSGQGTQAFRWTEETGMLGLGDLPGGTFASVAYGLSSNGEFVVGDSRSEPGFEAFLWSATDGMQGLGDLAGGTFQSRALGVSQSGEWVVGWGRSDLGQEAFLWNRDRGMVSIRDTLINAGWDMSDWMLTEAVAISADGRWIAGNGFNASTGYEQGWIVDMRAVPEPSSGLLGVLVIFAILTTRCRPTISIGKPRGVANLTIQG